jgi:hypothetical protein
VSSAGARKGPASAPRRPWYAGGLRFECTQCGNCCTGPPGAVWFTEEEGRKIAARLGIDEREFYDRLARREGVAWSLKEVRTSFGFDCIFLDRETVPGQAICGIYEARPRQCRTWPFWPENIETPEAWRSAKRRTPCPGMDRGKLVPFVEIRIASE